MRPIIMVMLAVDLAMFATTAFAMTMSRPRPNRRRSIWSTFALSLVVCAVASWNIAEGRGGQPGADILQDAALVLLGMGLMAILMAIRHRRGLDSEAPQ